MATKQQKWNTVKAKICLTYGTVRDAAAALRVSPEAMRQAVQKGTCPGVRAKMEKHGLLAAA